MPESAVGLSELENERPHDCERLCIPDDSDIGNVVSSLPSP